MAGVLDMLKLPESIFNRGLPRQRVANLLCLLDTLIIHLVVQSDSSPGQVRLQLAENCKAITLDASMIDNLEVKQSYLIMLDPGNHLAEQSFCSLQAANRCQNQFNKWTSFSRVHSILI